MNTSEIIAILTEELDKKLAVDIKVIDISKISDFADYFFICSANNPNQLSTLVDTTQEVLEKNGITEYNTEGRGNSDWILIDCIDIVIHIFHTEAREFYNLEHMWQDGDFIDIDKYLPKRGNE